MGFSEIVTNHGEWDSDGRLRVSAYEGSEPHGCPRCPKNLCTGRVLDRWLQEPGPRPRVIYVGDGGGDLCPALRLGGQDTVLARDGYSLCRRLTDARRPESAALQAQLRQWKDGA